MAWRLAPCLVTLRHQVDLEAPTRKKGDDGTVSSEQHRARDARLGIKSDHDPDESDRGTVRALDLTHDPHPGGLNAYNLGELLRRKRDRRLRYVIVNRRIFLGHGSSPWTWTHYSLADRGGDPHTGHVHISVEQAGEDDDSPWDFNIPTFPTGAGTTPGPMGAWTTGKASWFSQYPRSAGSKYGWRDTGDKPNSNALHVPDSQQGVAFFNRATLGKWFWVKAPNGKLQKLRQTDIGPAPWTGRKIDIAAVAAERYGYSPHTFPTGSVFAWQPA